MKCAEASFTIKLYKAVDVEVSFFVGASLHYFVVRCQLPALDQGET